MSKVLFNGEVMEDDDPRLEDGDVLNMKETAKEMKLPYYRIQHIVNDHGLGFQSEENQQILLTAADRKLIRKHYIKKYGRI